MRRGTARQLDPCLGEEKRFGGSGCGCGCGHCGSDASIRFTGEKKKLERYALRIGRNDLTASSSSSSSLSLSLSSAIVSVRVDSE